MLKYIFSNRFLRFFILLIATIVVTYLFPSALKIIWYLALLILYFRSKDEAFWLAFFLVTVDGFMGFFGLYAVSFQLIPGLPAIELAQFYILLTIVKASRLNWQPYVFYQKYIIILFIYLVFLAIWGQMMGFTGGSQGYFRLVKLTIPFLLFYSIPRLFNQIGSYERLFSFIFLISIAAFITQLFTLLTGLSPAGKLELTEEQISEAGGFRGFYNIAVTLLGLFGALFFLSNKGKAGFSPVYLSIIVFSAFGMAFLSATRGWIIGFGLIITLTVIMTQSIRIKWRVGFIIIAIFLVVAGLSVSKIKEQVKFSIERTMSLEELAKGDITAENSVRRLDVRSPRVMKIFKESPIFGWGFSDKAREYSDGHVANQTLLMTSGIVGITLLYGFFVYFSLKLFINFKHSSRSFLYKNGLLIFIIFLIGWFFIHSTSGQHFNYMGIPDQIIPQAIFFSFGAMVYKKSKEDQWLISQQPDKNKP